MNPPADAGEPRHDDIKIGRIALRQEGGMWNAYWAPVDSMEGAVLLGSIRMGLVMGNPELKRTFMALMRQTVDALLQKAVGTSPKWRDPEPAPEHERAGHA